MHVDVRRSSAAASLEHLARWWTAASQAERFVLVTRAIHGEEGCPSLSDVHLAAFLAEVAAGEVDQG